MAAIGLPLSDTDNLFVGFVDSWPGCAWAWARPTSASRETPKRASRRPSPSAPTGRSTSTTWPAVTPSRAIPKRPSTLSSAPFRRIQQPPAPDERRGPRHPSTPPPVPGPRRTREAARI